MKAVVYSMPTCTFCDKAKNLLILNNVEYEEVIVGETISVNDFMAKFPNVTAVPVVAMNEKNLVGYNALLEELTRE